MRDSLGGSFLLNLVIIFAGVVIALFVSILSYSKAYRIKNRIVEIIEKYGVYEKMGTDGKNIITEELNPDLAAAGYTVSLPRKCANIRTRLINEKYGDVLSENRNIYGYDYCVFEVTNRANHEGIFYVVVSFIHFEIPLIGDWVTLPVYGETRLLGKKYDY